MQQGPIIAAIDLSERSLSVLEVAQRLAAATGSELHSAYVLQPLRGIFGEFDLVPVGAGQVDYDDHAQKAATSQLYSLAQPYGVRQQDCHVLVGKPVEELVKLTKQLSAETLVVGRKDREGVDRLLGSTVTGLLREAVCDVLVAGDPSP